MTVYIAENYDGDVIGAVLASNQELANAFWQGSGLIPHTIRILSEETLKNHPTGVIPIVRTIETRIYDNGDYYTGRRVLTKSEMEEQ